MAALHITLETLDGQTQQMHYQLHPLSKRVRGIRSAKAFFLFLGLALVSILFPAVHFFSVPVLLVTGLVVAQRRWFQAAECDAEGICPFCQAPLKFSHLPV